MAPPRKRGKRYLLMMSVGALGIVYGDIGTSPLYAFRESFRAAEGHRLSLEVDTFLLPRYCLVPSGRCAG